MGAAKFKGCVQCLGIILSSSNNVHADSQGAGFHMTGLFASQMSGALLEDILYNGPKNVHEEKHIVALGKHVIAT